MLIIHFTNASTSSGEGAVGLSEVISSRWVLIASATFDSTVWSFFQVLRLIRIESAKKTGKRAGIRFSGRLRKRQPSRWHEQHDGWRDRSKWM